MVCPECGNTEKPEVYTNILDSVTHPAYMIYAPTCSQCGHKFAEKENLVYGEGYDPNVTWFGGIRLSVLSDSKRINTPKQSVMKEGENEKI